MGAPAVALNNELSVLVIGNYRPDDQRSMIGYEQMVIRELGIRGIQVNLAYPKPMLFPKIQRRSGVGKFFGYIDKFIFFSVKLWQLNRTNDPVLIIDHANSIYIPRKKRRKYIVICHDVFAIRGAKGLENDHKVRLTGRIYQWLIFRGICRADRILCVSNFTKSQLLDLAPQLAAITGVAESSLRFSFTPKNEPETYQTLSKRGLRWKKYFLHVGCVEKRKNRNYLAQLFAELGKLGEYSDYEFAVVGPDFEQDYPGLKHALGISSKLRFIAKVSDEELNDLYSGATALIFPSTFEGFGWPIIEAQASGCPTFTGNLPPMIDVGGTANTTIDLNDATSAANAIRSALESDNARIRKFASNVSRFSTDAMVNAWLRTISNS